MSYCMLNTPNILKEAKAILDDLQIPFCLFLGTALWAYRDWVSCPWDDDDVDLAVDAGYYKMLEEIKSSFTSLGFSFIHGFLNKDWISPEVSFKKDGVKIDIFFLSDLDGKKCWRFYLNEKSEECITKFVDKKHFETFDRAKFYWEEYNIPGLIEEYLEANYWDWKTPIHRDNWVWYRDNKSVESGKVSVIIPVWWEYKRYLSECVNSVKNQTYKNYEIIIVDDCTDLPTARNRWIKKAIGEWILPLDVDDRLEPSYLEKTINKGDIVTTSYSDQNWPRLCPAPVILLENLKKGNQVIACSLFKRKVWEEVGGYDESMKDGYEDWDFWIRCLLAGYDIEVIDEPLYFYRKHNDSMVEWTKKKHKEIKKYIIDKNFK